MRAAQASAMIAGGMDDADQAQLYVESEMAEPELHRLGAGEAFVFSARAPYKQGVNEDAAAVIPVDGMRGVLAVADGVGSLRAGATASAAAVRELAATLRAARGENDLRGAILDGIERANTALLDHGIGAGTTLAAVEIQGERLRPYHVGDSEILLVGQRGRVKHSTLSHAPVAYAVESGLLEAREALHHEDRHLISNVVGTAEMRIEVGPVLPFAPRDTLVLGSDGLFDNLHRDEVVQLVRRGRLADVAHLLVATCQQRMLEPEGSSPSKPDDLTFIVFRRRPGSEAGSGT
jgi:serine/threonine protein phosphatase PrpC